MEPAGNDMNGKKVAVRPVNVRQLDPAEMSSNKMTPRIVILRRRDLPGQPGSSGNGVGQMVKSMERAGNDMNGKKVVVKSYSMVTTAPGTMNRPLSSSSSLAQPTQVKPPLPHKHGHPDSMVTTAPGVMNRLHSSSSSLARPSHLQQPLPLKADPRVLTRRDPMIQPSATSSSLAQTTQPKPPLPHARALLNKWESESNGQGRSCIVPTAATGYGNGETNYHPTMDYTTQQVPMYLKSLLAMSNEMQPSNPSVGNCLGYSYSSGLHSQRVEQDWKGEEKLKPATPAIRIRPANESNHSALSKMKGSGTTPEIRAPPPSTDHDYLVQETKGSQDQSDTSVSTHGTMSQIPSTSFLSRPTQLPFPHKVRAIHAPGSYHANEMRVLRNPTLPGHSKNKRHDDFGRGVSGASHQTTSSVAASAAQDAPPAPMMTLPRRGSSSAGAKRRMIPLQSSPDTSTAAAEDVDMDEVPEAPTVPMPPQGSSMTEIKSAEKIEKFNCASHNGAATGTGNTASSVGASAENEDESNGGKEVSDGGDSEMPGPPTAVELAEMQDTPMAPMLLLPRRGPSSAGAKRRKIVPQSSAAANIAAPELVDMDEVPTAPMLPHESPTTNNEGIIASEKSDVISRSHLKSASHHGTAAETGSAAAGDASAETEGASCGREEASYIGDSEMPGPSIAMELAEDEYWKPNRPKRERRQRVFEDYVPQTKRKRVNNGRGSAKYEITVFRGAPKTNAVVKERLKQYVDSTCYRTLIKGQSQTKPPRMRREGSPPRVNLPEDRVREEIFGAGRLEKRKDWEKREQDHIGDYHIDFIVACAQREVGSMELSGDSDEYIRQEREADLVQAMLEFEMGKEEREAQYGNRYVKLEEGIGKYRYVQDQNAQDKTALAAVQHLCNRKNEEDGLPPLLWLDWTGLPSDAQELLKINFSNYSEVDDEVKEMLEEKAREDKMNNVSERFECRKWCKSCNAKSEPVARSSKGPICQPDDGQLPSTSKQADPSEDESPRAECTRNCKCSSKRCGNRALQRGRRYPLILFRTRDGGWTVRTGRRLPARTLVTEYIGRVQMRPSTGPAAAYDFIMNHAMPPADASKKNLPFTVNSYIHANESRFFSHSCFPNMTVEEHVVERFGKFFVRFAFYTNRTVHAGEELTFDYAEQWENLDMSVFFPYCKCKSPECRFTEEKMLEAAKERKEKSGDNEAGTTKRGCRMMFLKGQPLALDEIGLMNDGEGGNDSDTQEEDINEILPFNADSTRRDEETETERNNKHGQNQEGEKKRREEEERKLQLQKEEEEKNRKEEEKKREEEKEKREEEEKKRKEEEINLKMQKEEEEKKREEKKREEEERKLQLQEEEEEKKRKEAEKRREEEKKKKEIERRLKMEKDMKKDCIVDGEHVDETIEDEVGADECTANESRKTSEFGKCRESNSGEEMGKEVLLFDDSARDHRGDQNDVNPNSAERAHGPPIDEDQQQDPLQGLHPSPHLQQQPAPLPISKADQQHAQRRREEPDGEEVNLTDDQWRSGNPSPSELSSTSSSSALVPSAQGVLAPYTSATQPFALSLPGCSSDLTPAHGRSLLVQGPVSMPFMGSNDSAVLRMLDVLEDMRSNQRLDMARRQEEGEWLRQWKEEREERELRTKKELDALREENEKRKAEMADMERRLKDRDAMEEARRAELKNELLATMRKEMIARHTAHTASLVTALQDSMQRNEEGKERGEGGRGGSGSNKQ